MDTASWTTKDIAQTAAVIFQGSSFLSAIFIYRHQRKSAARTKMRQQAALLASEKQENRSRLTEAYMRVHAYILSSQENIDLMEGLLRRGHNYVDLTRHGEMTRAIELIYLKLNAFFLEWNYRKTYVLDMKEF